MRVFDSIYTTGKQVFIHSLSVGVGVGVELAVVCTGEREGGGRERGGERSLRELHQEHSPIGSVVGQDRGREKERDRRERERRQGERVSE